MTADPRILLVDDNETMLIALKRLHRRGFNIDTALDPVEALCKITADGPYAVVVSDWHMPNMHGPELLAKVREQNPNTTLILLTGGGDQRAARELIASGAIDRVLIKPCSRDIFAAELASAIELYNQREALPAPNGADAP